MGSTIKGYKEVLKEMIRLATYRIAAYSQVQRFAIRQAAVLLLG